MNKHLKFIILNFLFLLATATVSFGQEKTGKFFVKAATTEVDGQQIPDADLEQAVKDVKKSIKPIYLADKESEADFLIVINERNSTPQSGNPAAKSIIATLYRRENGDWKPATKLKSGSNDIFWSIAAENIVKKAVKWLNENRIIDSIPDKPSIDLSPFIGRYIRQDKKSDYLELKLDGALFVQQDGKAYTGTGRYDIKDSVITFFISGTTSKGEIRGDTIIDPNKSTWIKQKP